MTNDIEKLRYPIGKYQPPAEINFEQLNTWIDELAVLPGNMREAVKGLSDEQLDTPYRPGGWTLRQVVHHVPDSHMNSYMRFKLALTEDYPIIRPYDEAAWAECEEAKHAPVAVSLNLLDTLHTRFVMFLRTLKYEDFERTFTHPEHHKTFPLNTILGMYAWHGAHHLHHILATKKAHGW